MRKSFASCIRWLLWVNAKHISRRQWLKIHISWLTKQQHSSDPQNYNIADYCYYCYRLYPWFEAFGGLIKLYRYTYTHTHTLAHTCPMRFYCTYSIFHQFRDDPKWLERDYHLIRLLYAQLSQLTIRILEIFVIYERDMWRKEWDEEWQKVIGYMTGGRSQFLRWAEEEIRELHDLLEKRGK